MNKFLHTLYLLGGLAMTISACLAQPPDMPPFDAAKAKLLSPERRVQLDVAFFNEFVLKSHTTLNRPDSWPRGERVRAMGEEGYELAYIAEQIFDFHNLGLVRKDVDYQRWWQRVVEMAEQDDPSALCLIWRSEYQLRGDYGLILPRQANEPTPDQALERAAQLGHPQCMGDWGNWRHRDEPEKRAEWNLKGARMGCVECRIRISSWYRDGLGLSKSKDLAWCWITEAWRQTDAVEVLSRIRSTTGVIWPTLTERPRLTIYRPNTNCGVIEQLDAPFEPERLERNLP